VSTFVDGVCTPNEGIGVTQLPFGHGDDADFVMRTRVFEDELCWPCAGFHLSLLWGGHFISLREPWTFGKANGIG